MNLAVQAIDKVANPARVADLDKLRKVVSGKTVLVTGASYGVGEATARKLASAEATVLAVARSEDKLDDLVAYASSLGDQQVRGGNGLDQFGPIFEGSIAWLIPVPALIIVLLLLGQRRKKQ